MALNGEYLDSLPNSLVEIYSEVEISVLEDMARRIMAYDFYVPANLHQHQKLIELGLCQKDIINRLSVITGKSQEEIVSLLTEACSVSIEDDVQYYTMADVYEPSMVDTEALYSQLNSGLLQTEQAFKNITHTTAITASNQFIRALDKAWTQIATGTFDYNTAIRNAIIELSGEGLHTIEYPSGYSDKLEVSVRRAVMTGANQTAMRTQEKLADQLNVDLVEVTAHGGARKEHAKWQGKVFSRHGDITIDGKIYEDLAKATGYGRVDGLGGANCRHNFYPYVIGSPRSYSKEQLKDYSAKNIEYDGNKMTEYEAQQRMRAMEREIRKNKRTIKALESVGEDASKYRTQVKEQNKIYSDFCAETGMKQQNARKQVG